MGLLTFKEPSILVVQMEPMVWQTMVELVAMVVPEGVEEQGGQEMAIIVEEVVFLIMQLEEMAGTVLLGVVQAEEAVQDLHLELEEVEVQRLLLVLQDLEVQAVL